MFKKFSLYPQNKNQLLDQLKHLSPQNKFLAVEKTKLEKEMRNLSELISNNMNSENNRTSWLRHRPFNNFNLSYGISLGFKVDGDSKLVERLIRSYHFGSSKRSESSA